ncbi:MAG: glycosyltransferase [Corynebacterium sp.]|uniref:glycosyltransferase n=1 Tax=Corynebacterium sp. TaxID=1720 RepID=UPI003F9A220C
MNNDDRSLTLPPGAPTLWVHWGRTGGGPRFLADLTDGDRADGTSDATYLSYNPDAEIAGRFAATPVPSFPVPTYNSTAGVVLGLPRLVWNSLRLRRWIRARGVGRVVCVMESVYQSLALPVLIPRSTEYVACIHDGSAHPGEENIVQTIGRRNELRRADRIVTFSDAVTGVLSDQVSVPISTGTHPPFDLQDAATEPRDLPDGTAGERVPVIGLFGRLQKYKGIDVALEAMRILRDRGAPPCELQIIGSGPEERLRDTPLGGEATWDNRWIPEEEVTDIVRSFDIMLLPYTEASQSGPVTLALAHAVPCVGTPVGAIPSQVEGFGVVTDSISPADVADGIEELLTDPGLYRSLSAGAVERVASQPDWGDLAELIRDGGQGTGSPATAPAPGRAQQVVTRVKWLGQRVFGLVNGLVPLKAAGTPADRPAGVGRTRVVLPASHGSFGDEAMGLVAAQCLSALGRDVDLVVPGESGPWREDVPDGVGVLQLSDITAGPGNTPTAATVRELTGGPLVVIGADTLAGDYELAILATRVRMLNRAAEAGQPAALVNFSLPSTVHPDARRILRGLSPDVEVRARDALSAGRATEVLGRSVPSTPDIAALLEPSGTPVDSGRVVFVPNAHLGGMYGVTTEHLVELWRGVAETLGRPVEVVVHDIRESVGDIELGRRIVAALEDAGVDVTLTIPATAAGAKAAIAGAPVCVSARMHACVAALSSGVPTVGIGYVGKFSGQFAWYGSLGSVAEYRPDLTAQDVVDQVGQVEGAAGGVSAGDPATDLIRRDYGEMLAESAGPR